MCWRERIESLDDFRFAIADFRLGNKTMIKAILIRLWHSPSENRKSKIQNRKLAGIIALVVTFAMCGVVAEAQQPAKIPRIGFLGNSTPALEENLVGPFREGLRDLGYVEGKNILIEYRWAEGKYDRFPTLIGELVAQKVDIIVTAGTPASLAVKKQAPSIPLVMLVVGDPIGTGLIESLAHPGGNVTGLSAMAAVLG